MRILACLTLLTALSTVACDKKTDPQPVEPTPEPSTTPAEIPTKPPPVADLEVKAVQEQLKCPSKTFKDACDMLEGFEKGKGWDLTTIQSQEARYFGKSISFEDGVPKERWVFMIARKVPLNEVTPGDLPVRIAMRDIEESRTVELQQATKLHWLLQRDDAVTKRHPTAAYILSYTSNNWDTAAPTNGSSTILHIAGGTYLREGPARALIAISMEAAKPGSAEINATVSKLYPLSW